MTIGQRLRFFLMGFLVCAGILTFGPASAAEKLKPYILGSAGSGDLGEKLAATKSALPEREDPAINLDRFLARIERELMERAIGQAQGNKTQAAELLGISRPRFYRRLLQLGLDSPEFQ